MGGHKQIACVLYLASSIRFSFVLNYQDNRITLTARPQHRESISLTYVKHKYHRREFSAVAVSPLLAGAAHFDVIATNHCC